MATTAPKGDDRSEKRRRPFGKATTVYETEICSADQWVTSIPRHAHFAVDSIRQWGGTASFRTTRQTQSFPCPNAPTLEQSPPLQRSSPFGAVVAISDRPNFSSEYPRHVRDFPGQNLARWIEVAWNSGKSRTCRGYSELKFGRSEMATTAPKGDDRSEKRRRPFGKATTVYETEICVGFTTVRMHDCFVRVVVVFQADVGC
ncbi:hypothetical protein Bbelb_024770 [Branchiostoma belcheri]|nr:hypothetical protein Bbelb_024770 [Branchiostoma belcheri]